MDEGEAVRHVREQLIVELLVIDLEHGQIDDAHRVPDHRLGVIGEPLGHQQQRKVFHLGVVEELDRVLVEAERDGLDEGDVHVDHLLIVEVVVELYQLI